MAVASPINLSCLGVLSYNGDTSFITVHKPMLRYAIALVIAHFTIHVILADDSKLSSTTKTQLIQGCWLIESVQNDGPSEIGHVWKSVVTILDDRFTISNFVDQSKQLQGAIRFIDAENAVDLIVDELDFNGIGLPHKIEPSVLRCLIAFHSDTHIVLSIPSRTATDRPQDFERKSGERHVELRRGPQGYVAYPEKIRMVVSDRFGKPVEGATVARFAELMVQEGRETATPKYSGAVTTNAEGIATFMFNEPPGIVCHEKTSQIAFPNLTPASMASGKVQITLSPAQRLAGSLSCKERDRDQPLGRVWVRLYNQGGSVVSSYLSTDEKFLFQVPPGSYKLFAYGPEFDGQTTSVTVGEEAQSNFVRIELSETKLIRLKGHTAPDFVEIASWYGEPVHLSDLKGRYVLIDFWGYWCGPCVASVPKLMELHARFSDKGLVVIGVHVDLEGEVNTPEKLDAKLIRVEQDLWKGKKLTFPNALVSGELVREGDDYKMKGTLRLYGIDTFPTTILIDRQGKIVGEFRLEDPNDITKLAALLEKASGDERSP